MCQRAVRDWLVLLTMEMYIDNFLDRGYDCIAQCKLIIYSDLVMLEVDNPSHIKLLLEGVQFLNNTPEFTCSEPCELHTQLEKEEDTLYDWAYDPKYIALYKFLEAPRNVYQIFPQKVPNKPFNAGSTEQDELPETTWKPKRTAHCRKAINFQ